MPVPASKIVKLSEEVCLFFASGQEMDHFTFRRLKRDAEKLPTAFEVNLMLGLLYALTKKDELMIKHFEAAISINKTPIAYDNYAKSLNFRHYYNA